MSNQFIDSHHHLWDLDEGTYLWLEEEDPAETEIVGDYSAIRRSYVISDLLADFEGSDVVKSVHIQAEYGGPDQVWETAWLQGIADTHGFPHGIIAKTDLSSDTARAELERHGQHANMRGVRNFVQGDDLHSPEFLRGLRALLDLGFLYDLNSTFEGMAGARRAAELVPDLQFILGHAGMPLERSKEYFNDLAGGNATPGRGTQRGRQDLRSRYGRSQLDCREHPPLGFGNNRSVRCRTVHVRLQLACRPFVQRLRRRGRRLS